ncbi:alkylhydroperoxidase AhpD family core domain-containing protein [Andreprevotia lacus DSM 23236]|jgi:AhpD family alkylhydroperoxidase|uniref:Alkylhydroperoxidase AhpD family core domain-containing protein n=1 Tax=Andreprevotia lacus DSM 23236 TaxID=1121001 RepID=A0A1W1XBB7_9NEIS|nr:carboxymuconolactone decarboxylase family protein [Andreprevotia lacus]SMC20811.1 alkylhydroperoxidase AhpD family core domain-containing protein [Andreprevotia lacus DSM 23236]
MSTEARLSHRTLAPQALAGLVQTSTAAKEVLGGQLTELIYLRISQINGCAYCIDMHARDLLKGGEDFQRINSLVSWREVDFYSERERAALNWAEALARIDSAHAAEADFAALRDHFSDVEIVALTYAAAVISAFNRVGVGMQLPVKRAPLTAQ